MKMIIDVEQWERKDHYNFFRRFEEPFFGITIEVDCTLAYKACKNSNASFFLWYLHKSLIAANETEPFRYRIEGDNVLLYDKVNASPTINRPDGTFGFSYFDYHLSFQLFSSKAQEEIEKVQRSTGLIPAIAGENVIHYSSVPWLKFTSISHARAYSFKDSIPKISFGKMTEVNGIRTMPVSVHAHHGLMDGYHVAQFMERFQDLMDRE
jgi:chloramphenicol O-acetyltransferase type A